MIVEFNKSYSDSEINDGFFDCFICHKRLKPRMTGVRNRSFRCDCGVYASLLAQKKDPKYGYLYLLDYVVINCSDSQLIFDKFSNLDNIEIKELQHYFNGIKRIFYIPNYLLDSFVRNKDDLIGWITKMMILT